MKTFYRLHSTFPKDKPFGSRKQAFTLTELLVALATVVMLALLTLPALAGVQNKGGRARCADNLRRIGMTSMIYANEYNGWLPICNFGPVNSGGKVNYLNGVHYSRIVAWQETPNTRLSQSSTNFQNLGLLYKAGLVSEGNLFFCPADWGSAQGANNYLPLFTSDASGAVRSSYEFNPRYVSANPNLFNNARRYQKTSQLEPHKLFAVDFLEAAPDYLLAHPGMDPSTISHARERGWNVLFTDGSVQFSRSPEAYALATQHLITDESYKSALLYDFIFNYLEQDH